jgi:hypothetical protein
MQFLKMQSFRVRLLKEVKEDVKEVKMHTEGIQLD